MKPSTKKALIEAGRVTLLVLNVCALVACTVMITRDVKAIMAK